ncbi:aspartate/glutamate racemase family protein [Paraburkholderia sp. BR10882]|uniref:aspartate/glutamate racemase family protein n=1 Tax=unclassified Paraburkholderia TaxID=2615204 RepID=UPI0034CD8501
MSNSVYVINPNSLVAVTDTISRAVKSAIGDCPLPFRFVTLADAPPGIMTQRDADIAAPLVANFIDGIDDAAGFIVACYSDPGVFAAREITSVPVLGIGDAGLVAALRLGKRPGVIAVSGAGIDRHWRYYRTLGIAQTIAGERSIDLTVAESANRNRAMGRLIEVGGMLRDLDGADVVVLGCAGMTEMRDALEKELGVPVVDPCTAAAVSIIQAIRSTEQAPAADAATKEAK